MNKQKLLIADSSPDFCGAMAQQLQEEYCVQCCGTGTQALELLRSGQWDVLVLELLLPELDGISLLHQLLQEGIRPQILVASRFITPYVEEMCVPLGICYLLRKPCSVQAAADRIREMGLTASQLRRDPYVRTSDMLLRMRFQAKHDGFAYLREAFPMLLRSPKLSMTKELYPAIGVMFGREGKLVERAIRSSIEAAWKVGDRVLWQRYFPECTRRPSNALFLSRMLEELRLEEPLGEKQVI